MVGAAAQKTGSEAGGEQDHYRHQAPDRGQGDRVGERRAGVAWCCDALCMVALGAVVAADEHEPAAGADRGDDREHLDGRGGRPDTNVHGRMIGRIDRVLNERARGLNRWMKRRRAGPAVRRAPLPASIAMRGDYARRLVSTAVRSQPLALRTSFRFSDTRSLPEPQFTDAAARWSRR